MQYFGLILKLLPFIINLMRVAEDLSEEPGSGAQKKEAVIDGTKIVISALSEVSTGGQKETWDKIKEPLGKVIDLIAGLLF